MCIICTATIPQCFGTSLGSTSTVTNESGVCTSQQAYYPYGAIRPITPTPPCGETVPTDFGFTGQRRDVSSGLMYYGARYYDAGLGRFVSADTIVPDIKSPQALNRYSYVFNNPIKYSDPTGHCPKPPSNLASVICFASFIPTQVSEITPFGVLAFKGDNRNFSSESDPDTESQQGGSRFWVWIDVKTGNTLRQGVHSTYLMGDSGPIPARTQNILQSTSLPNGGVQVEYHILCSYQALCLIGPDGSGRFEPDGKGGLKSSGFVKAFPNLEAYYWENGQLKQVLFQWQNYSPAEIASGRGSLETALNQADSDLYWTQIRNSYGDEFYFYLRRAWGLDEREAERRICDEAANKYGGGCNE